MCLVSITQVTSEKDGLQKQLEFVQKIRKTWVETLLTAAM